METSVKIFFSSQTGAPALSGSVGALAAVLDACLVSGWGAKAMDSLVVAGGIATATIGTGHAAVQDGVVLISNASVAALNGEKRVSSVVGNTFTFPAPSVPDGAATGASMKIAAAGWEKRFSAGNVAVFRPTDIGASGFHLRVDDTSAQFSRVVGYVSMSDINTGGDPFPATAQVSGGLYWFKSEAANVAVRNWILIADGRAFYLYIETYPASYAGRYQGYGFGEAKSLKQGDAYGGFILGNASSVFSAGSSERTDPGMHQLPASTPKGLYIARGASGLGSSVTARVMSSFRSAESYSGGTSGATAPWPNGADGSLLLNSAYLIESYGLRGVLPGILHSPQSLTSVFSAGDRMDGNAALPGRRIMAIVFSLYETQNGTVFIDITGPWR
jgi:hypothetical protein